MSEHEQSTTQDKPKLDVDWTRTIAGALAAVSTAVLVSTLGAAGTLVGAALGSVAATVTTALYAQGLARSRAKVQAVQELALARVGVAQVEVARASRGMESETGVARLEHAELELSEASAELEEVVEGPTADPLSWRERFALLPWKRIALAAAGLFVVVVAVISLFEVVTGRPVSSYTGGSDKDGGTSISRLTGGGGDSSRDERGDRDEQGGGGAGDTGDTGDTGNGHDSGDTVDSGDTDVQQPEDQATPSDTTTGEPTDPEAEPGRTPTEEPSESGGVPLESTPSAPTPTPTPTPTPSAPAESATTP